MGKYDIIIGNPPYSLAKEFILKSLDSLNDNGILIFLLRTAFLESKSRYQFWQENKVLITRFSGGKKRYFDPNYSTSICYCVMDQECLEQFLGSIHLLKYYDSSKIDDLYVTLNLYSEGSMLINRKGLGRVNRNSVSTENPKMYALTKALNENVVKFAKKKNDLDEGEDDVFTHQKNIIKDPYSLYYPSLFKESFRSAIHKT